MTNVDWRGGNLDSGTYSPTCRVEAFQGVDPATGLDRSEDIPFAKVLLAPEHPRPSREPYDTIHVVGLYLGFSLLIP